MIRALFAVAVFSAAMAYCVAGYADAGLDAGLDAGSVSVDVVPETVNVSDVVSRFKGGEVRVGIGLLLCLLVSVWRQYGSKFAMGWLEGKGLVPWAVAASGLLLELGVSLQSGEFVWWKWALNGFLTSASAMAFWSLAVKSVKK